MKHFSILGLIVIIFQLNCYSVNLLPKNINLLGNESAYSVMQLPDSSLLFCGSSDSSLFVVKTTINGDTLWSYKLQDKFILYEGYDICTNTKGQIGVVGYSSNNYLDILVLNLSQNGNLIWKKEIGGKFNDLGYSITANENDGFIVVGQSRISSNDNADLYCFSLDNNGSILWEKSYDWGSIDWGYSIKKTTDKNYVIAGTAAGKYLLMKIDEKGDTIFTKRYNNFDTAYGASDIIEIDNGYILCGGYGLIKVDKNGNYIWSNNSGGYKITSIDNYFYCIGWEYQSPIDYKMTIVLNKFDFLGNEIYKKKYSAGFDDWGYDIIGLKNNLILLTGRSLNINTHKYDIPLYIVDNNGNLSTKINSIKKDDEIILYPNSLFKGESINIFSNQSGLLSIRNMNGKIVYSEKIESNSKKIFNTSNLSVGLYIFSIMNKNKQTKNYKIVIK